MTLEEIIILDLKFGRKRKNRILRPISQTSGIESNHSGYRTQTYTSNFQWNVTCNHVYRPFKVNFEIYILLTSIYNGGSSEYERENMMLCRTKRHQLCYWQYLVNPWLVQWVSLPGRSIGRTGQCVPASPGEGVALGK